MVILVLDAYPREGRDGLQRAEATLAGNLYERLLTELAPDCRIDRLCPADADTVLPDGVAIEQYDGIVWTGSSLTIHNAGDERVRRQIELARAIYRAGVPSFGSCWAAQIACVAAGGSCAPNPKGREFGISRRLRLTPEGRTHPLFTGKPSEFDAFTSHADEVTLIPPEGKLLASNDFSRVQAVAIDHDGGSFWAVQYHPEYDLHEIARLCVFRMDELVAQAMFVDRMEAHRYIDDLEALHRDPSRRDIQLRWDIDSDLLDPSKRSCEVRNWLDLCVRSRRK